MSETFSPEDIQNAIHAVEHPEIASTLTDLGMIRDVEVHEETKTVSLTLVVPFMGIPAAVRDYMIASLTKAVEPFGVTTQVSLAEMNDAERQAFFSKEQANWRG